MPNAKDDDNSQKNASDDVGEGNHDADRRYRDATERFVKSGAVDPAAKEARRAIDNPAEREELKKAEDLARHHKDTSKP